MRKSKRIILDTNFLIDLVRFRVEIEDIDKLVTRPYRFVTLNGVEKELRGINSKHSKVALKLLELGGVRILKRKGEDVDNSIMELAKERRDEKERG